uniref:Uncharacterized protein n=1 Tax=Rhizophora mucronata TaxID=61149 RepID=A0A2P2KU27_RHIMU
MLLLQLNPLPALKPFPQVQLCCVYIPLTGTQTPACQRSSVLTELSLHSELHNLPILSGMKLQVFDFLI